MHLSSHDLLQLGVGILTSQGNDSSMYFCTAPLYQLGFERVLDQKIHFKHHTFEMEKGHYSKNSIYKTKNQLKSWSQSPGVGI